MHSSKSLLSTPVPSRSVTPKRKQRVKSLRTFWPMYVMLLPGVLFLIVNNYIPMFGVLIAFKNINYADGILGSPWAGLKNFEYLFKTETAWIITRNTILYNSAFIVLNLVFGVGFAILLNELRSRFLSKLYQSAMFLPFFLSAIVVSYLGFAFLGNEHGYINTVLLPWVGMEPIQWYAEAKYWPFILPLINTWKGIGYFTVIYMAAIVGISDEYYEAAVIDGASKWQQITKITIPLLMPVIIIMTLLQIGKIFYADFGLFYQVPLDAGLLLPTTNVIDTYVYRTFLGTGDIGMSSAAGLYQAVVGFVLVLGSNFIVRKFSKDNALF
jgi:putative aldouronate transport system permease protein